MSFTAEEIARVCHEANRAVQLIQADPGIAVSPPWDEAPEDQHRSCIAGVSVAASGASPAELHASWCREKLAAGWRWGAVKSVENSTHPCLVSYFDLPEAQRAKDALFGAIVKALIA